MFKENPVTFGRRAQTKHSTVNTPALGATQALADIADFIISIQNVTPLFGSYQSISGHPIVSIRYAINLHLI